MFVILKSTSKPQAGRPVSNVQVLRYGLRSRAPGVILGIAFVAELG
jgi:hypothetical protein